MEAQDYKNRIGVYYLYKYADGYVNSRGESYLILTEGSTGLPAYTHAKTGATYDVMPNGTIKQSSGFYKRYGLPFTLIPLSEKEIGELSNLVHVKKDSEAVVWKEEWGAKGRVFYISKDGMVLNESFNESDIHGDEIILRYIDSSILQPGTRFCKADEIPNHMR